MMERERVQALQAYEAREEARLQEQRYGAAILQQQIVERAHERRRQEELRERVSDGWAASPSRNRREKSTDMHSTTLKSN